MYTFPEGRSCGIFLRVSNVRCNRDRGPGRRLVDRDAARPQGPRRARGGPRALSQRYALDASDPGPGRRRAAPVGPARRRDCRGAPPPPTGSASTPGRRRARQLPRARRRRCDVQPAAHRARQNPRRRRPRRRRRGARALRRRRAADRGRPGHWDPRPRPRRHQVHRARGDRDRGRRPALRVGQDGRAGRLQRASGADCRLLHLLARGPGRWRRDVRPRAPVHRRVADQRRPR